MLTGCPNHGPTQEQTNCEVPLWRSKLLSATSHSGLSKDQLSEGDPC
jgi:hypothetical protein